MAIFGIEINKETSKFLTESNIRLQSHSLLKNPFNGSIDTFKDFAVVEIEPILFKFYWFAWLWLVFAYAFNLAWGWYIPVAFFLSTYIFWDKRFYYLMLKIGLKKSKYKGEIKLLKTNETIKRLILWARQK